MRPLILKGHSRPLTMVKYNAEGDLLFSCAKDDSPTLWYTSTGERVGTYDGHTGAVWALDVSEDSKYLLTAGGDLTVKLWDVKTGQLLISFPQGGPAKHVEWAEGCEKFLVVNDPFSAQVGEVRVYSRSAQNEWTFVAWSKPQQQAGAVKFTRATWSSMNEHIITGDSAGVIEVHDPVSGLVSREIAGEHKKKINCMSWNADKTLLLVGSADNTAKLFDVVDWKVWKTFETEVPVNAVAISPIKEHVFVAGGQDAMNVTMTIANSGKFETKLFHMVFGDEFGIVRGHFGPVNTIALHPDGTGFTSGSEDGFIRIHVFDKDYFSFHTEFDDLDALKQITKN